MKRHSRIGICLVLGFSLSAFEFAECAVAGEPLPDASLVAYKGGNRQQKPPQQPTISDVTLTGVIDGLQSNGLTIKASKDNKTKDQKPWFVTSASDTEFTIRGTATVDYLRKGQLVEFSGQIVDSEKVAGKPQEEKVADAVSDLTVLSRKRGSALAKKGGTKDHAADSGGIGDRIEAKKDTDSETSLTVPDDDSKAKAGDGAAAKPKAAADGPTKKILGKILTCDEKSLTVTSGQRTIHVALADLPTINVELSAPKLTADSKDKTKYKVEGSGPSGHFVTMTSSDLVGSKIVVHGKGAETKTDRKCLAKTIDVTLAAPLSGTKSTAAAKKAVAEK